MSINYQPFAVIVTFVITIVLKILVSSENRYRYELTSTKVSSIYLFDKLSKHTIILFIYIGFSLIIVSFPLELVVTSTAIFIFVYFSAFNAIPNEIIFITDKCILFHKPKGKFVHVVSYLHENNRFTLYFAETKTPHDIFVLKECVPEILSKLEAIQSIRPR